MQPRTSVHRRRSRTSLIRLALLVLCALAPTARAQPFAVSPIVAPSGGSSLTVEALGAGGDVVGWYVELGTSRAFAWRDGTLVPLRLPAGMVHPSAATAIAGATVVGWATIDGTQTTRAIRWTLGAPALVPAPIGVLLAPPPEGGSTRALAVNDAGVIVGWMDAFDGGIAFGTHAARWSAGTLTDLGPPIVGAESQATFVAADGSFIGFTFVEYTGDPLTGFDRPYIGNGTSWAPITLPGGYTFSSTILGLTEVVMNDDGVAYGQACTTGDACQFFGATAAAPAAMLLGFPSGVTPGPGSVFQPPVSHQPLPLGGELLVSWSESPSGMRASIWDGAGFGPIVGPFGALALGSVTFTGIATAIDSGGLVAGTRVTGTAADDLAMRAFRGALGSEGLVETPVFGVEYCGRFNVASQIDDLGTVFGVYAPTGDQAYVRLFAQAGTAAPVDLTPADGETSFAQFMNRDGDIVGRSSAGGVTGWFFAGRGASGTPAPTVTEAPPDAICQDVVVPLPDLGEPATEVGARELAGGSVSACVLGFAFDPADDPDQDGVLELSVEAELTVVVTVSDDAGRSDACAADISVRDLSPPRITECPPSVAFPDPGSVELEPGDAIDNSGGALTWSYSPTTLPDNATTSVTWTVSDARGNRATCVQAVTVGDPDCALPPDTSQRYDIVPIVATGDWSGSAVTPLFVNAQGDVAGTFYGAATFQQTGVFFFRDGVFTVVAAPANANQRVSVHGLGDAGQVIITTVNFTSGATGPLARWTPPATGAPPPGLLPVAITGTYGAYDVPGLTHLGADGAVLARIYSVPTGDRVALWRPSASADGLPGTWSLSPVGAFREGLALSDNGVVLMRVSRVVSGSLVYNWELWAPPGAPVTIEDSGAIDQFGIGSGHPGDNIALGGGGRAVAINGIWHAYTRALDGAQIVLNAADNPPRALPALSGRAAINVAGEVVGIGTNELALWAADGTAEWIALASPSQARIARGASIVSATSDPIGPVRWDAACGVKPLWTSYCASNSVSGGISATGDEIIGTFTKGGVSRAFVHVGGVAFDLTPSASPAATSVPIAVGAGGHVIGTSLVGGVEGAFVAGPLADGAEAVGTVLAPMPPDAADARCRPVAVNLGATPTVAIGAAAIDDGSTVPAGCGSLSLSASQLTFGVGVHEVTLTAAGGDAASDTCTATVTVTDVTAPTISCPAAVVVEAPEGVNGIAVDLGLASAADNSGSVAITNDAPTLFPVVTAGTTQTVVTWTATDGSGRSATCQQVVTVVHPGGAELVCADGVAMLDAGQAALPDGLVLGVVDESSWSVVSIDAVPASLTCAELGTTRATFTATTSHPVLGARQVSCTVGVEVTEPPPVVSCRESLTLAECTGAIEPAAIVDDVELGCGGTLTLSQDEFPNAGSFEVTLTATNGGGESTCTTIVDAPGVGPFAPTCKSITVALGPTGEVDLEPEALLDGIACHRGATVSAARLTFGCEDARAGVPVVVAVSASDGITNVACDATVTVVSEPFTTESLGPALPLDIDTDGRILLQTAAGHVVRDGLGEDVIDDDLPVGAGGLEPRDLDGGRVVGRFTTADAAQHGFVWSASGGLTDLGVPAGGSASEAVAINAAGTIVGTSTVDGSPRAWVGTAGALVDLHDPVWAASRPIAINDAGQVLLVASVLGPDDRVFRWDPSEGLLAVGDGSQALVATALSPVGVVVGGVDGGGAFTWDGTMTSTTPLAALDGDEVMAIATGINARGDVVGVSATAASELRVVVWRASGIAELAPVGELYPEALDGFPPRIDADGGIYATVWQGGFESIRAVAWSDGIVSVLLPEGALLSAVFSVHPTRKEAFGIAIDGASGQVGFISRPAGDACACGPADCRDDAWVFYVPVRHKVTGAEESLRCVATPGASPTCALTPMANQCGGGG